MKPSDLHFLTVMLADDWNRNKVRWGSMFLPVFGAAGGRSAPTVTGSGLWVGRGVRWVLVSGVLVGGEGGE